MSAATKRIPGKRIRTWHRNAKHAAHIPQRLRNFARYLIRFGTDDERAIANEWAGGKCAEKAAS